MSTTPSADMFIGLDVGSTTVKAIVVDPVADEILWRDYQRHDTKQPEKTLEMLHQIAADLGLPPERFRMFATGSGAGICQASGRVHSRTHGGADHCGWPHAPDRRQRKISIPCLQEIPGLFANGLPSSDATAAGT